MPAQAQDDPLQEPARQQHHGQESQQPLPATDLLAHVFEVNHLHPGTGVERHPLDEAFEVRTCLLLHWRRAD